MKLKKAVDEAGLLCTLEEIGFLPNGSEVIPGINWMVNSSTNVHVCIIRKSDSVKVSFLNGERMDSLISNIHITMSQKKFYGEYLLSNETTDVSFSYNF